MDAELTPEHFEFIARIGHGAYGSVIKTKNKKTGEIVAIKQISLSRSVGSDMRGQSLLDVFREISALQNSKHKNIVELFDVIFGPNSVALITEYVESSLKIVIADIRRPLNIALPRHYFRQLLFGIAYLHHLGIMHRDIKPDNILITAKNEVKIADLGLACLYHPDEPTRHYENQVATRWYRAPELLFGATQYTPAVDIWAVGVCMAEYFNGEPFFAGQNDIDQIVRVFRVLGTPTETTWPEWETLPDHGKVLFEQMDPIEDWTRVVPTSSKECLDLIHAVVQLNPRKRPEPKDCLTFDFFLGHPTLSGIAYKPPTLEEWKKRSEEMELVYEMDPEKLKNRWLEWRRQQNEDYESTDNTLSSQ